MTPLDLNLEYNRDQFEALLESLYSGKERHLKYETKYQRKDGSEYPVEVRLQLSPDKASPVFVAIVQDVSERKHYIEELEYKALHDTLTRLPNRSLLLNRLQFMINVARRETSTLAVFIVDVLRLREINDLLGHQNGDLVLQEIARRLQEGLRNSDTVARLGGDEFVVVTKSADVRKVHHIAKKIQSLFESPIFIEESPLELESVIGIALYPEHGENPGLLLQHADIAMRVAKGEASGTNIYNPDDDPFSVRRLKLHGELRKAINDKSLAVYYQPKVDISSGKVISVEALSRWPHPKEGMIPPNDFIPMVEQSGLIRPFTHWVLDEAIKQSKIWMKEGIDLTVSVNLSARNLHDPNLIFAIKKLLKSQQVDPDRIILEITESAVMSRPENALKVLTELHAMGLIISIDDFGTGYSSLAYLKKLPVNELKIDYSFVSNILNNNSDAVIVKSTIDLAHNLGMSVVAEGVENKDILDLLVLLQCDKAQGYYFSRPMPPEEFSFWLQKTNWPYVEVTPHIAS
jgi:diguanylate cyclase (GGDEF)-like protein